jgi:hypothetical protein
MAKAKWTFVGLEGHRSIVPLELLVEAAEYPITGEDIYWGSIGMIAP